MVARAKTGKDMTTTPEPGKQVLDQANATTKEQRDAKGATEKENLAGQAEVAEKEVARLRDDVATQATMVKKEKQLRGKVEEEKKKLEEGLRMNQESLNQMEEEKDALQQERDKLRRMAETEIE